MILLSIEWFTYVPWLALLPSFHAMNFNIVYAWKQGTISLDFRVIFWIHGNVEAYNGIWESLKQIPQIQRQII